MIDMKGDVTKDCLGGFVERYVPLFVSEVKHYSNLYSDEMKSRLYRLDLAFQIENVTTMTKAIPTPEKKKDEPDKF